MIGPERALVTPRVVSAEASGAVPVEEILAAAEGKSAGAIEIVGGPGRGKTTALAHLAVVAPGEPPVALLADASHAVLRLANLAAVDLEEARLTQADLRGADLSRARFVRADLAGADLRGAQVRGANLRGAAIANADFYLVDLRDARYTPDQYEHFLRCGAILLHWK